MTSRIVPSKLIAVVVCLLSIGCQQSLRESNPWPKGPIVWEGYGTPGAGKISVTVDGDVAHPGQYYLNEGANLESIMHSVGGKSRFGDMGMGPRTVRLIRSLSGQTQETNYPIGKMTVDERKAVLLEDGDALNYLQIVF